MTEGIFSPLDSVVTYSPTRIQIVDDYALGIRLGEGSYAKVKEGIQLQTRRLVAVKIFSRRRLDEIEDGELIVQREVSLMRRLSHANLVAVLDDFLIGEKMYIVMEYVNGGTLQSLLESAPLNRLVAKQASSIFRGISYLQEQKVVHRDIKPDNILLTTDGQTKIADFGAAIALDPYNSVEETIKGAGSPAFQPPEACQDGKWLEEPLKYDVWSAGIVLYIMTTGKYPFERPNLIVLWNNISNASYTVPEFVGAAVTELIEGMMEVDAKNRWSISKVKKHSWLRRSRSMTPRKTIRDKMSKKSGEIRLPNDDKDVASSEKESEGSELTQKNHAVSKSDPVSERHVVRSWSSGQEQHSEVGKSRKSRSRSGSQAEVPIKHLQTVFDEHTVNSILQSLANYDRGSNTCSTEEYYSEGIISVGVDSEGSASEKRNIPVKYVNTESQKDKKCLIM